MTSDATYTATFSSKLKESEVHDYVMFGLFKNQTNWTEKPMVINPSSSSEYMIQGVTLYQDDLFKIHMYGDTWYGFSNIKSSVRSGLVSRGASDDNIKILSTGTYDIYSDYNESDGGHIYLAKANDGGGSGTTIPVTGVSLNRSGKLLTYRITDFQLTATVSPYNATNKEVTWSSSDTSIATVTSAGRVITYEKTGTTTITVKTVDGNKTAECLIYVKADGRPDYYLTGTINGYTVSTGINNAGTYTYPALPLSTNHYLIPDVELLSGDKLVVRANVGNISPLKDRYNQTYEYLVTKNMSANIYLNTDALSCNYNYLNVVEKR